MRHRSAPLRGKKQEGTISGETPSFRSDRRVVVARFRSAAFGAIAGAVRECARLLAGRAFLRNPFPGLLPESIAAVAALPPDRDGHGTRLLTRVPGSHLRGPGSRRNAADLAGPAHPVTCLTDSSSANCIRRPVPLPRPGRALGFAKGKPS